MEREEALAFVRRLGALRYGSDPLRRRSGDGRRRSEPVGLDRKRRGLQALLDALGLGGFRTRDAAFDRAFRVRGAEPQAARAWLTPERRRALLGQLRHSARPEIAEGALHLLRRGRVDGPDELAELYARAAELGEALA